MPKSLFNAARALDSAAWSHPDDVNLVFGDTTWTIGESALVTRRLAQLFAQAGVSAGDRVLVVAHNSPYHLLTFVACARLGALFVPVSHRVTPSELQTLVDFTAPRVVIADAEVAGAAPLTSQGTTMSFVIDDDPASGPLAPALENGYFALAAAMEPYEGDLIADGATEGPAILNRQHYPGEEAALFFTTGSVAGMPRAALITHENLWWANRCLRDDIGLRSGDTLLVTTPMCHIGGFNGGALDLFCGGGRVVIMRSFDAREALRLIAEQRVTAMFSVPTVFSLLLEARKAIVAEGGSCDTSSLRVVAVGGAQVPAGLMHEMAEFGPDPINVWGMAETAGAGTFQPWGRGEPGSIGRPFAYVEARVVNDEGEDSTAGELWVRGHSVSAGYWHNEEANAVGYSHGWLRTGDVVSFDGTLTITGRLHDRISTGGEVVDPIEVESVLLQCEGLNDAAVVGIPDARWGNEVVAVVVGEPAVDIRAFVAGILSPHKVPRRVVFAQAIAHDAAGKVDRADVAAAVIAADAAAAVEH